MLDRRRRHGSVQAGAPGLTTSATRTLLGYAVVRSVLAPLGLAAADASNDDGVLVLLVAGVLLPPAILTCWAVLVCGLARRSTLARRWVWPLAFAALAIPFVLFAIKGSS